MAGTLAATYDLRDYHGRKLAHLKIVARRGRDRSQCYIILYYSSHTAGY